MECLTQIVQKWQQLFLLLCLCGMLRRQGKRWPAPASPSCLRAHFGYLSERIQSRFVYKFMMVSDEMLRIGASFFTSICIFGNHGSLFAVFLSCYLKFQLGRQRCVFQPFLVHKATWKQPKNGTGTTNNCAQYGSIWIKVLRRLFSNHTFSWRSWKWSETILKTHLLELSENLFCTIHTANTCLND